MNSVQLKDIVFSKNTPIKLKNGKIVKIKDIHLGDILENNSEVYGTLKLKGNKKNPYYQLWSRTLERYIYVTGDHKIFTNNQKNRAKLNNYIEVKDYEGAEKTEKWDKELLQIMDIPFNLLAIMMKICRSNCLRTLGIEV